MMRFSILFLTLRSLLRKLTSSGQCTQRSIRKRQLISLFAVAAVLLSVLGIYSIIAFAAALREQEMALRVALGCQRSGVLTLILTSGVKLAAIGCGLGLFGSMAASRLLGCFLFGVSPFDPVVLPLSAFAMLLLALAASALPARRAAKTDPMQALRGE